MVVFCCFFARTPDPSAGFGGARHPQRTHLLHHHPARSRMGPRPAVSPSRAGRGTPPAPTPPRPALRSYLRGCCGAGCAPARRGPHGLRCRASRGLRARRSPPPWQQLRARAPPRCPGSGSALTCATPAWPSPGPGRTHGGQGGRAGFPRAAGSQLRLAWRRGSPRRRDVAPAPRAPTASGFVSPPAPPRHRLRGGEQRGPGSRRDKAGLGLPIVAGPGAQAGGAHGW